MMKLLRRIAAVMVAFLLMVSLTACGKSSSQARLVHPHTLTVGVEGTYAPYAYRKNGKLTGFEIEVSRQLAKQMGYKVKFVPTKWDSLIAGLGSKKFDVVLDNIAETPARKKAYAFSKPYAYAKDALIMRKDNNFIHNMKDIKGQRIAAGTGSVNADNVKKWHGHVVSMSDFSAAVSLVRQKRVAALLDANAAYLYYQRQNPSADLKSVVVPSNQVPTQKIGVLMNKHNPGLQKQVNQALTHLRKNGTLKRLSMKYFNGDITKP
nr:transporter substrate-binding domain-containing protein [Limosilactobacillus difficilis]